MGWPDVFAQCCTNGSGGTTLVDSGVSVYFVQLCVVGVGSSGSMFYLIKSGEVDVLPYQVDAVTDADTVVSATPRTRLHVGQHFGEVSERERPGGLGEPSSIFLVETLFSCEFCVPREQRELIQNGKRQHTVVAVDRVECLCIHQEFFSLLVRPTMNNPESESRDRVRDECAPAALLGPVVVVLCVCVCLPPAGRRLMC